MSIKCEECGVSLEKITHWHVFRLHGMTTAQYREKYPDAPLVSKETLDSMARSASETWDRPGYRKEVGKAISDTLSDGRLIGIPHNSHGPMSEEARENLRRINTGRAPSDETRERISQAQLGVPKGPFTDLHKRRLSEATTRQWADPIKGPELALAIQAGSHHVDKPNLDELMLVASLSRLFPGRFKLNSGTEECHIGGRLPDVLGTTRKEVIENFGTFYHNPDYFPKRPTEEKLIEEYAKVGYKCLVLWGDEACNESFVEERVKEVLGI